jgi:hypothetical protein
MEVIELVGSRPWTLDRKNISQDFRFAIHSSDLGEIVDEANTETLLGVEYLWDDRVVSLALLNDYIPEFFIFPLTEDTGILLGIASMKVVQINYDVWTVDVTYDVNDRGKNNSPDQGPSNGEQNSQEYTQLSFNSSLTNKKINMHIAYEVQKSTLSDFNDFEIPALIGQDKNCFIGESEEGVEGVEIYERNFTFSIVQYMPPTKLTYEYVRRITRLVGRINDNTFFGFPKGSVMCTGANGAGNLFQSVPVTLDFEVRNNFKFHPSVEELQPIEDTYVGTAPNKTFNVEDKFDQLRDPGFPTTSRSLGLPGGAGVHSGWSIVDYRRSNVADEDTKRNYVIPWLRLIFFPYTFGNFAEFNL